MPVKWVGHVGYGQVERIAVIYRVSGVGDACSPPVVPSVFPGSGESLPDGGRGVGRLTLLGL